MAHRRNRDERSDLTDMKALAAKARSETGGPVVKPNPAELSGVRPRRDSVIGMRLTPPPRTTSSELPNWFWGVLGCLSVLLVGFASIFLLARSGKLDALLGQATSLLGPTAAPVAAPPAPSARAPVTVVEEPERTAPATHAAEHAVTAEHAATAERAATGAHVATGEHAAAPPPAAPVEPARAGNATPALEESGASKHGAHSAAAGAAKAHAPKAGEAPTAGGGEDDKVNAGGEAAEAKASAARPAKAAAPVPKAAAADDSDDDQTAPGQDDVERALDALATRVRGCFVKYQIKGTARVRLVATPAGKAESINLTGDFEDTPTGLCVESVLSEARLPTFKGPPLKLSQSYQLR